MRNSIGWILFVMLAGAMLLAAGCAEGNKAVTQDGGGADGGGAIDSGVAGGDGGGEADAGEQPIDCDPMTDKDCLQIEKGEAKVLRLISRYTTMSYTDVDQGTTTQMTVAKLTDIIGTDVVPDPENWKYQIYGTDGYTFGGFATWTNMQHGYLEPGSRLVVWEPEQNLPRAYRVKDSYRVVISPAGP